MELLKNCSTTKYCSTLMLAFTYASCTTCKPIYFCQKVGILHISIPLHFQVIYNRWICKIALTYLNCKIMFERWCGRRTRKTLDTHSRVLLDLLTFLRGDRVKTKQNEPKPVEGGGNTFALSIL